jgi:hypothetical protein
MATVKAIISDVSKYPDAHHVSPRWDGHVVYGKAVNRQHPVIALVLPQKDGTKLVETSTENVAKLGATTVLTAAEAEVAYPIYTTTVEVIIPGRAPITAVHHGPKVTDAYFHGHRVLSSVQDKNWTLAKMMSQEYEIEKTTFEQDEFTDVIKEKVIEP